MIVIVIFDLTSESDPVHARIPLQSSRGLSSPFLSFGRIISDPGTIAPVSGVVGRRLWELIGPFYAISAAS
jgi:hypothetical protein